MACNCATSEQLKELYKRYGEKKSEKKPFGITLRNIIYKIGVAVCMVFITPALVVYVFYKAYGSDDRRINVKEFFKFKERNFGANVG